MTETEAVRAVVAPQHRYDSSPITGHRLRASLWHERGPWTVYLRGERGELWTIGEVLTDREGHIWAVPLASLRVPKRRVASLAAGMHALDALMTEAARATAGRDDGAGAE